MKYVNYGNTIFILLTFMFVLCISGCIPYAPQLPTSTTAQPEIPPDETPPPNPENHSPVIHNMQAQREVAPSSSVQISCIASDVDGDELFYSWSTGTGSLKGLGETITWIAPQEPGEYEISVTVNDGKGGENYDSAIIKVAQTINRFPSVSIIIKPKGGTPTSVTSPIQPLKVREWSVLEIECNATDPDGDELDYTWSVTEGKIDGEGSNVSYIAKGRGDQVITVTVTDETGRETTKNIYLHVQCCGG